MLHGLQQSRPQSRQRAPWNPSIGIHEVQPVGQCLAGGLQIPVLQQQLVEAFIPQKPSREEAPAGHS
jgi:hypothetical protein